MCVLSIKVPIRKKSGNLLKAPRTSSAVVASSTFSCKYFSFAFIFLLSYMYNFSIVF